MEEDKKPVTGDLELEVNTPDGEELPTVLLTDEDGTEEAYQLLGFQPFQGREFAVLCPADMEDGAEADLVIMESTEDGGLQFVPDEQVTQAVFDLFLETLQAGEDGE